MAGFFFRQVLLSVIKEKKKISVFQVFFFFVFRGEITA